jgi:peptidoglycan hydrolase-like protein with peptidoglycan-binding domain
MKTKKMKTVLIPGIILGFVMTLMFGSMASAQQQQQQKQAAPMQKPAVTMGTQTQTMKSPMPEAKMQTSAAQTEKSGSTMMKSTSKMPMMSSQEIKSVQEALSKDGYKLKADGIQGKHTTWAIKDFQKKNHLKVTGRADAQTLAKLNLK